MHLGRGYSNAIFVYTCHQVLEFSKGITEDMLNNDFYTIPDFEKSLVEDPQTQNSNPSACISKIDLNKKRIDTVMNTSFNVWDSSY